VGFQSRGPTGGSEKTSFIAVVLALAGITHIRFQGHTQLRDIQFQNDGVFGSSTFEATIENDATNASRAATHVIVMSCHAFGIM
jgi:hypothetical protein